MPENFHPCRAFEGPWPQLQKFFGKRKWTVPAGLVDATMRETPGYAIQLIELLYCLLTGKECALFSFLRANPETTAPGLHLRAPALPPMLLAARCASRRGTECRLVVC